MRKLLLLLPLLWCAQAFAAPAFVQSTGNCSFGGTNNTTATVGANPSACPAATGWTSNLTAGNNVLVAIWRKTGSATLNSIADGGDTCTALNTAGTTGTSSLYVMYAGYCVNVAGGSKPTITATFSNSEDTWFVIAEEVSGTATASPIDGTCTGASGCAFVAMGSTAAGTNAATTGNFTTTTNGDYIWIACFDDNFGTRTFSSGTTSQSWTTDFGPDITHVSYISEDGVQTTASASTVGAFTTAGGLTNPLILAIALKPSGAGVTHPATTVLPKTVILPKTTVL